MYELSAYYAGSPLYYAVTPLCYVISLAYHSGTFFSNFEYCFRQIYLYKKIIKFQLFLKLQTIFQSPMTMFEFHPLKWDLICPFATCNSMQYRNEMKSSVCMLSGEWRL